MTNDHEEGAEYPTNPTILELMEELGIEAEVEEGTAPVNENVSPDATGWTATYTYQGKTVVLYFYTGSAITEDATADQILSSNFYDAQYADLTFEEFCSELDYDSDSRKAEQIYNAVVEITNKLRDFLGEDFERFMEVD